MPESRYLDDLAAALGRVLGDDLVGVYAGGSWALVGYEPGRSDLDVAAVVRRPLERAAKAAIVRSVRHEALPCPARGLELVVYALDAVRSPTAEAAFELNLNTGAGMAFRADEAPVAGELHWFAIDRSVLARHGVALVGPPAAEVFAPPPRDDILALLAETLRWYERNAPDSEDASLNAARALRFARHGAWLSKPAVRAEGRPSLAEAIAELSSGAAAPPRRARPRRRR